ncbi:type II toxin-antitoxin system RelE/ParE family toxin [Oscillatoria salina]|uniref:type II toxin-antitoxin system RelE/ParE family toxin n=1 Tax=Oscillatoria salina TaxID=331517 RepID=UPI0013BBB6F7|nr:type II toxin-antitoxin system RelE/ParE family toxin [Oscillatoria salina]MBZ8182174.1 type II toxin-antitoxin system RelE/ParE family toxin [Oscillatoria salina IIICB1]NET90836.1 type II toxin-antitoxin system RelE/ParE family toxin [Kamptonema sp. SIO1D9]
MEAQPREIQNYQTVEGRSPFEEWLESLRDSRGKLIVDKRIRRVRVGNLGDYRSVGDGIFELRIDYGPGYRVYFGQVGTTLVLLLCGGDKSSQKQDILKAKEYWRNYERRKSITQ